MRSTPARAALCALAALASSCAARSTEDVAVADARSRHLAAGALPLPDDQAEPTREPTTTRPAAGAAGRASDLPALPPGTSAHSARAGTPTPGVSVTGGSSPAVGPAPLGGATATSTSPPSAPEPVAAPETGSAPAVAAFRTMGSVTDVSGDAGLLVPGHADLVRVAVEGDGTTARVVVETAAPVPSRLAAGEVAGVGVDLFVGDRPESDYQLFVDGSADGWFAYLYANGEIVRYPGSFFLGGSRMQFEVPWTALGGSGVTRFAAFFDWSQDAFPDNRVGEDHAPLRGTAALQR